MPGSEFRSMPRRTLLYLLMASLSASAAFGQSGSGTIKGVVSDPSGAVVPGAIVTIISAHGQSRLATSDAGGKYIVRNLASGNYAVVVEADEFSVFRNTNVHVAAGREVSLNVTLLIAAAQTQINVQVQPVQVSVSPSENASSVSISGSDLKTLGEDPDALAEEIAELAGPSTGSNGAEIYIDGFTGGDLPPKTAIREIRVNQNPFSAAYDRLGYGRVEVFTKPGSNDFHGRIFFWGNASAFNTHSPFLANKGQPPYHALLFSGEIGGPICKRASYFFAAQRRNINRDQLVNTETLGSDFQPSPFVAAVPNPRILNSITSRFDYQLTTNNTLTARYHYFSADENNNGVGTQSLPSQAYEFSRAHHLLQVSNTQVINPHVINETRFQFLHFHNQQLPADSSPTINVQGAFTGGGNSSGALDRHESHYELQNFTSINTHNHYLQLGGFVRDIYRREASNAGFNGSFVFDSLADYAQTEQDLSQGMNMAQIRAAGYGPSQFSITAGSLLASVNRLDGSLWAQDDWTLHSNLTLSYGLRLESQNVISEHADLAPRIGFAWGLGHDGDVKTVLRAGFGVFYDRFDDDQMIQAQRLNGSRQISYLVNEPSFYPDIPLVASLPAMDSSNPTVYRISSELKSPYALESAASIERQITNNATVSVTYLNSRGNRQFLTNDINAPIPGSYDRDDPSSGTRPMGAAAGNVYEYISRGIFRQDQVIANFKVRTRGFSFFGYYTLNNVQSDTSGVNSFPLNPYNILADYGRASFDIRHRIFIGGTLDMPYGIQMFPIIMARSGIPFSITLGKDLFGTGIHNSRPAYPTSSTPEGDVVTNSYGSFNVNPSLTAKLLPPNTETGPAAVTFNLRVSRTFAFGKASHGGFSGDGSDHGHHQGGLEGRGLSGGGGFGSNGPKVERRFAITLAVEAKNLFNNINLGVPVGNLNSPLFGQSIELASGAYSGNGDANRRIDLQLSFSF